MTWADDLSGAAVVGAIALASLLAAELWARAGSPRPEWPRKLAHTGTGLGCLFFPFLVRSPWVVLAGAALAGSALALSGRAGLLKCLHRVSRRTYGSVYYPLAIFVVYVLAYGRAWLYVSAVLTLTISDAFAALIGTTYGAVRYKVGDGEKSLEGSVAFLASTFLVVCLAMRLMTNTPLSGCVTAALLAAGVGTGLEAISPGGADNLFVPVGVCVALSADLGQPFHDVACEVLSAAGLCLVVGLLEWRARARGAGGRAIECTRRLARGED